MSLGKTFGLVALLTVVSKFAGLARDIVVAQAYGTSLLSDAYNYAYLLTGNILILFGGLGGPFHSATVAILTPRKNNENSGTLISQITLATSAVLLTIAIITFIFAPNLVSILASSYGSSPAEHQRFVLETSKQLQIMSPLIIIAGLVGISYGVLNVYNYVFWPSLSPAIASIAIIAAIVFIQDHSTGLPLAIGTLIGAIGQLIAQIPDLFKTKLKASFSFSPTPGYKEYTGMLWPAVLSTSIGQLNIYVDSYFTSSLEKGAWTAIINANRLVQLPLGVLLTAMLVPILPRFTEHVSNNKIDDLREELRRALRFLWFLALPISAILLAIPSPIIQTLYERGQFDEYSRQLVTTALLFLAPTIFFYVARDLITRVFYAYQDSKTPYNIAIIAIIVHFIFDAVLVWYLKLGIAGISLATTLITIFNLSLLTFFIRKKVGMLGFSKLIKPVSIMFLASFICGLISYHTQSFVHANIHYQGWLMLFVSVALASIAGLGVYTIICLLFKLNEPIMLLKRFGLIKAS
jgi:putative peptidoglycan lipid II flippase